MWRIRTLSAGCLPKRLWSQNSNRSFLPDLHSLDLFKGQPVPGSIINPGSRWAGMAGDPLRDLNCSPRPRETYPSVELTIERGRCSAPGPDATAAHKLFLSCPFIPSCE